MSTTINSRKNKGRGTSGMLALSRRDVIFTKDNKQAHSIGKTLHLFENMVKHNNWRLLVLEYSSYPVSFSILHLSLSLLVLLLLQLLCWTLVGGTGRGKVYPVLWNQTFICPQESGETHSPVHYNKPKLYRRKKGGNDTSQVPQRKGRLAWPFPVALAEGAQPPSQTGLFDVLAQRAGGGRQKAASFPSALPLCRLAVVEARLGHGWSVQRAGQCHTETCPPPAFAGSPLPPFHEQDNAKSCCACAHWGWGLKSWGIA